MSKTLHDLMEDEQSPLLSLALWQKIHLFISLLDACENYKKNKQSVPMLFAPLSFKAVACENGWAFELISGNESISNTDAPYMSPEEEKQLTPTDKTAVYRLGLIFLQLMVLGNNSYIPFNSLSRKAIFENKPKLKNDNCSAEYSDIYGLIKRMLDSDVGKRPPLLDDGVMPSDHIRSHLDICLIFAKPKTILLTYVQNNPPAPTTSKRERLPSQGSDSGIEDLSPSKLSVSPTP